MSNDDIDYGEIRQRVEKRMQARLGFIIHLITYVGINGLLWMIWLSTSAHNGHLDFLWPLFISIPWGIGLVAHAMSTVLRGAFNKMQEREIEQEIERERMRRGMVSGKRKNEDSSPMRLSDEGELIPDDEAESPRAARSNRR